MSERPQLEDLAHRVRDLPALPQAVMEIMQVLRNDQLSAERCIHLIEQDPALAARTMRLANSAFWGVAGRVSRITDAVNLLGLRTLSGVLAAAALTQSLPRQLCPGFDFAAHWRHSIGTALASRLMAAGTPLDPEEAFLAGLVHDFGQLVLTAYCPQAHEAVYALASREDLPLMQAEVQLLGLHHGQVGALLARHWHFPEAIVAAVEHHHRPPAPAPGSGVNLIGLVHLGDAMAHALDLAGRDDEAVPEVSPAVWQALALPEERGLRMLAEVERGVHDMCAALSL